MPYATSSADGPTDLLEKLRSFAESAGWHTDAFRDRSTTGKALSLHCGDLYVTFFSQTTGGNSGNPPPFIGIFGHTGFSNSADPNTQSQSSPTVMTNYVPGPYHAVHFFCAVAPQPYLHVVLETQAGTFKHFGTGQLVKQGIVDSGQYVYGSAWYYEYNYINNSDNYHAVAFDDTASPWLSSALQVRADFGGISPRWGLISSTASEPLRLRTGWRYKDSPLGLLHECGHSQITGRAPGYPLWCAVNRTANLYTVIGHPPDLRYIRLDSYAPNEELVLGPDRWKLFPVHRKNGPAGTPNSATHGFALRIT